MASVLCVQQKMSKARSGARVRAFVRGWVNENTVHGWYGPAVGYQAAKARKLNALSITALEAR